jgi:molybdate transport system ATP-binding protein
VSEPSALEVHVTRRIHPGLTLDVEFALGREVGVVFGASGAGKTSLLRLIAGLDRPHSGYIQLGARTLFDADRFVHVPLRRRSIGMIFQDDLLFPHLSARDNIRFGLQGSSANAANARVAEVSALCGVEHILGRRPDTLSGGERQRIGLARALAPRPQLLLCDEPISAIDVDGRSALVDRLRAIQQAEAIPVLYVTHSPSEAIALGSRLFLIADGKLIDQGPPLDVLASPMRAMPAGLEGVRNVFAATVISHDEPAGETRLGLLGGPELIVPYNASPVAERVSVAIRADDIMLALGQVDGLSARNRIPGVVERVLSHGAEAEVVLSSGQSKWIVSVVASAVTSLALAPGVEVRMIVKARSCHLIVEQPTAE